MLKHSVVFFCTLLLALSTHAATPKPIGILTPAGGELYVVGSKQRVRLDAKTTDKSVVIELSIDGGAAFTPLGVIDNSVKDKTKKNLLEFTVPNTPSSNCVIRATGSSVSSSSAGFSIAAPVTVVVSPPVQPGQINSGSAADGSVLAADGSGGAAFTSLTGKFVRIPGDTMTGALTLSGNPTENLHSAPKQYVDAAAAVLATADAKLVAADVALVAADATLVAADVALTANVNSKVNKTGDSMTGKLEINNAAGAELTLTGATAAYTFDANATGFVLSENTPGISSPIFSANASTGDVLFGGGGVVKSGGDGSIAIDGALTLEAANFNNNFTANNLTCCFFCNSTTNSFTVTLPNPATTPIGRIYLIKKIVAANTVNISSPVGTIEGATTIPMTAINDYRLLICAGTLGGWQVIGKP